MQPTETVVDQMIADLQQWLDGINALFVTRQKRFPEGPEKSCLLILAAAVLDLGSGLAASARPGLARSTATLARAVFETMLLARWILAKPEYSQRYLRSSSGPTARIHRALRQHYGSNFSDPIPTSPPPTSLPSVQAIASQAGCTAAYASFYPWLSQYTHSGPLSAGFGIATGRVVAGGEYGATAFYLGLARFAIEDFVDVVQAWCACAPVPTLDITSWMDLSVDDEAESPGSSS